MDDAALEARLFAPTAAPRDTPPHPALAIRPPGAPASPRHLDVAVARVQRDLPRRLRLQPVLRALPALASPHRRGHAPGAQGGREAVRRLPRTADPHLRRAPRGRWLLRPNCSWPCSGRPATSTPRPFAPRSCCTGSPPTCHAFEAIGGCPAIVVCDNLRSGVTRPHRYEPDINATYQEMAAHYGVAIIPARSYKPRDKAKVEAGVLLAERWIMARLRNERFTSLGEANAEIAAPGRVGEQPAVQEAGRIEAEPLRGARPPGLASAPGRPLRVRHLEEGQGQHRLPRRGPHRAPLLLGPLPPGRRDRRGAPVGRDRRGLLPSPAGGQSTCAATAPATPPTRPTCPSPTVATPSGRRHASSAGPSGPGRPPPSSSKRSWRPVPIPSRAFAPVSASSAWPTATAPIAWRRPARARLLPGPTATSPSSPSCAPVSTANRCPTEDPTRVHPDHDNLRGPDYYQ